MAKGSCNCGEFTYEFTGEPKANVVCHCVPCLKTAGANGSTNTIIPSDRYNQLSGDIREWTRKGVSGKDLTYYNCATCGCIMYVRGLAMEGLTIVKTGTIDDAGEMGQMRPGLEIFTRSRVEWCPAMPGTEQKEIA
ncbi:hypothetical protein K431DRAFT_283478 [Polychaeton citri CBS 116435]|uniref:CENP-V/GFA domain-containing protein n=1 Tax=Polychaeton citri CBS 116435 TaxID=1314669 RepID=A0A9P4USD7_9PEZI|nr:hypothetical protein K431DRAFT_283478 [Polychaeton citri CBS 116435]